LFYLNTPYWLSDSGQGYRLHLVVSYHLAEIL